MQFSGKNAQINRFASPYLVGVDAPPLGSTTIYEFHQILPKHFCVIPSLVCVCVCVCVCVDVDTNLPETSVMVDAVLCWTTPLHIFSSGSSEWVKGGGQETWNLCDRLRWPSLWLFLRGPGGPGPLSPRIRYRIYDDGFFISINVCHGRWYFPGSKSNWR